MYRRRSRGGLHTAWWTAIFLALTVCVIVLTAVSFLGTFRSTVPVTVSSDRAGLVMEPGSRVRLRGVEVGRVRAVDGGTGPVRLTVDLDSNQIQFIPANIEAQIRASTAFGAKYVDLVYPGTPSAQTVRAGSVIQSMNVSTEVNTVFQSLTEVVTQIDPAKLNAVLSALSEGLRGQGPVIGEATSAANRVLVALNARTDTIDRNWRSLKGFADAYAHSAQDILSVLDAASTTSTTIADNSRDLDALLLSTIGFSTTGTNLLAPMKDNLVTAINAIQPTTSLLMKYNPELTCMLVGGKQFLDNGGYQTLGGNGRSLVVDTGLLLGDDQYSYPANLPVVGAKGGPDGKPGCGSLPVVADNWPQRQLITNTGWGTGLDLRPNPGIGFPGYANYLPGTRGVPEPPSIRNLYGGPAPGPVPYPGAPPYGAPMYAPDGTPLWPGLPPGVPSTSPPPDHVIPGTEPVTPPEVPASLIPTPMPPPAP